MTTNGTALSRFVAPGTTRLQLSAGDWLLVRTRLNYGERAEAFERGLVPGPDGDWRISPKLIPIIEVAPYLLDWSFPEFPISGKGFDEIKSALYALDPDDFAEVRSAVQTHIATVQATRDAQKKTRSDANASGAISASLSAAGGVPM